MEDHAELKDVVSDLHVQVKIEQREVAAMRQARDTRVEELKHLKERLSLTEQRCASLQVPPLLACESWPALERNAA